MLMTAVAAAFADLVNSGKSADNLLGNGTNRDEAKKCMWLAGAAIKGARLLWTSEVRTLNLRGESYIDGNLLKKTVPGGDPIESRKNNQNPYSVRHELTMFLNVNELSPVRPAIGGTFLLFRFPNQYGDVPTLPNEKAKDDSLKRRIGALSFAEGMTWLVFEKYYASLDSGKAFKVIPEVVAETAPAYEGKGEDLVEILGAHFELTTPFSSIEEGESSGFLIKLAVIKEALEAL
jgi:hypothetical protein